MKEDAVEALKEFMVRPRDISKMSNAEKANNITLYFIGYLGKPLGISNELMQECCKAFNASVGKIEREAEAVEKVLERWDEKKKTKKR